MGPKASLAPSGTTNESGHSPVTVGLLVKSVVISRFLLAVLTVLSLIRIRDKKAIGLSPVTCALGGSSRYRRDHAGHNKGLGAKAVSLGR
jgi:hypothetical protein